MKQATQTNLNLGFSLAAELEGVSDELISALIRVMMFHVGREKAIKRTELVDEINSQGIKADDRTIRLAISELRRQWGIPFAGTGGIRGGYWILKDQDEANSYMQVELHDRGISLLEQESAIRKGFDRWYPNGQLRLQ
jgi:hypothetical protein